MYGQDVGGTNGARGGGGGKSKPWNEEEHRNCTMYGDYEQGTTVINYILIFITGAPLYRHRVLEKVFLRQYKEEKRKYPSTCLEQRHNFTSFVCLFDVVGAGMSPPVVVPGRCLQRGRGRSPRRVLRLPLGRDFRPVPAPQ